MKHIRLVCLSLLLVAKAGGTMAQTQKDSTTVSSDSITWSKELEKLKKEAKDDFLKQMFEMSSERLNK